MRLPKWAIPRPRVLFDLWHSSTSCVNEGKGFICREGTSLGGIPQKRCINTGFTMFQKVKGDLTKPNEEEFEELDPRKVEISVDNNFIDEHNEGLLDYYMNKAEQELDGLDDVDYFEIDDPNKKLYYKMIDLWLQEAGETKRGHREFVTTVMHSMSRFNVTSDISAYTKLLDCFPQSEHTGIKRDHWFGAAFKDKIADHLLGDKLIKLIGRHGAIPNETLFAKTTDLFGRFSPVTLAARGALYWYGRLVTFNKHPISLTDFEKLSPAEIAFYGLRQMNPNLDVNYEVFHVDKAKCSEIVVSGLVDSIVSVQTPEQKNLLANHDPSVPIFVEGPHKCYFRKKTIQYYVMRTDPRNTELETTEKSHILSTKSWWEQLYKTDWETNKPILTESGKLYPAESFFPSIHLEKDLSTVSELEKEICQVEKDTEAAEGPVYAMACTDFTSPVALESWIKGLVQENKNLTLCTVVFREEKSFLINAPKEDPTEVDMYDPKYLENAGFI